MRPLDSYTNEICLGVSVPVSTASFCGANETGADMGRYSVVFFKIVLRLNSDSAAVIWSGIIDDLPATAMGGGPIVIAGMGRTAAMAVDRGALETRVGTVVNT